MPCLALPERHEPYTTSLPVTALNRRATARRPPSGTAHTTLASGSMSPVGQPHTPPSRFGASTSPIVFLCLKACLATPGRSTPAQSIHPRVRLSARRCVWQPPSSLPRISSRFSLNCPPWTSPMIAARCSCPIFSPARIHPRGRYQSVGIRTVGLRRDSLPGALAG